MVSFFRYLFGYVRIKIISSSPEDFINILIENGVSIWSLIRRSDYIAVNISFKDYKLVRSLRTKLVVKPVIKLTEKHGFIITIKKIFVRKSIVIGITIALIINIVL